jgi:sugar phosphate isomerase/epimerase
MGTRLPLTLNVGFFSDLAQSRRTAEERGMGLEVQHFADGQLLDGTWRQKLAEVKQALAGFGGYLSMHAPFTSMDPASFDPQARAVSRGRYFHALQIADQLGARAIVYHLSYPHLRKYHGGLTDWIEPRITYWGEFSEMARKLGITLVLENTHEESPLPQTTLLSAVNSPALRACLDTGHANMTAATPIGAWIAELAPWLSYVHAHNNCGATDDHWPFNKGTLDMPRVLRALDALPAPPRVCLELHNYDDQLASITVLDEIFR